MRNNKGQFTKGNKAASKKHNRYSFMNVAVPNIPIEQKETDPNNEDYQPFGTNNDFPQAISKLNRKSPVHRALLNSKTFYITGNKFTTEDAGLEAFLSNVNADDETLREVHRKLVFDKLSSGNAYMQIAYDASKSWVNVYHIDFTKCRVSKDGKSIMIHPNWDDYKQYENLTNTIPLYPEFKAEGSIRYSMVHIKDYEPEFQYYGVPSSIAGLDAAGIAYKTNKWNVSRLDNDFKTSGVLIVDSDFSDEDAKNFEEDFKDKFTGEDNQGQVLMINTNGGAEGNGTSFTPVTNASEGDWINLHDQSTNDLVIAHSWFRSLAGLATEGALGNTQAIKNEYSIAMSTVVNDEQRNWLDIYQWIFSEFGLNAEDLSIDNKAPLRELEQVSDEESELMQKLEIVKMATDAGLEVEEAKRLAGLE